jgi:SAM-dependent methyltransferase
MMFTLENVVPWGRSFDEYRRMFSLTEVDLRLRIIGCADGPAGFNAEATRRGASVISCDPIYRWDASRIQERIAATYDGILDQARRNAEAFVWDSIRSVEELGQVRTAAMQEFLADYDRGKADGRYVEGELPDLPFADSSFELALCSHFLFLYSSQLGEIFHQRAVRELCRVAREVRIFPLLTLGGERSPYVDRTVEDLRSVGHDVLIDKVPYEFQRGGNQMMRIRTGT